MDDAGLTVLIATIRCHHGQMQHRPCGRCSALARHDMQELGTYLIEVASRVLMRLDGHTGRPTPLTYAAAVDLLKAVRPAILARGAQQPAEESSKG